MQNLQVLAFIKILVEGYHFRLHTHWSSGSPETDTRSKLMPGCIRPSQKAVLHAQSTSLGTWISAPPPQKKKPCLLSCPPTYWFRQDSPECPYGQHGEEQRSVNIMHLCIFPLANRMGMFALANNCQKWETSPLHWLIGKRGRRLWVCVLLSSQNVPILFFLTPGVKEVGSSSPLHPIRRMSGEAGLWKEMPCL